MKKYLSILTFTPATAFAAAGWADAFYSHQRWIFPVYAYCVSFGLLTLIALYIASLVYRIKIRELSMRVSGYLLHHKVLAIIFAGLMLAIPIGIITGALWDTFSILMLFPLMGLMTIFPFILIIRKFRENFLLSPFWIKWSLMISISAVVASLLFLILTKCNLLSGTDISYFVYSGRSYREFHLLTHPFDSLKHIWENALYFIGEIPIALLLYWSGILSKSICKKISGIGHRKQEMANAIYKEKVI